MDINNLPIKYHKPNKPETEIDYSQSAIPKKYREKKKPKGLKPRSPKKKNQIDMTVLNIPKEIRYSDPDKFLRDVKKPFCEVCGVSTNEYPHHVESRGSGGPDIKENGIQLCQTDHTKAHSGEIPKALLFLIIAKRERVDVEDLIEGVKQQCV